MLKIEHLNKGYQYLYQELYKDTQFRYNSTIKSDKLGDTFIVTVHKKLGTSLASGFLLRYLNFQYNYWQPLKLTAFHKHVVFTFLFGPTALDRYLKRDKEFDYQLESVDIFKRSVIDDWFFEKTSTQSYDNPIRSKYLNTDKGFVLCLQHTTLYDFHDSSCTKCQYKDDCKSILKKNFPKIYKNRYGKNTVK